MHVLVYPGGSVVKNLPAMQETPVWSLGRENPWRREWQPTPVFLPGESHGQRSLVGYSPWGRRGSDMTGWLSTAAHTIAIYSVNMLFQCLLHSIIFVEVSHLFYCHIRYGFFFFKSLAALKISQCLLFNSFIMIWLGVYFHVLVLLEVHWFS